MNTSMRIGLASVLALATAAPAFAQYQPTPQYQRDQRAYEGQRAQYEQSRENYREARQDYAQSRRDYDRRRADWERARAAYDARYGFGSYTRVYGAAPIWDEARYSTPSAGYYGANTAYSNADCRPNNNSSVTAGIIGALAGAALGSNVAARNARTEGAVLGAVVLGAIGAGIGRANDRYKCDARGPYYTRADTMAYRESAYDRQRASGRYNYSYYNRQRCRLAPASVDSYGEDYRYVRVCPDRDGRYRITG